MPRYTTKTISYDKGSEIVKGIEWEWICENNHGLCHWNKITGELMWFDDDENVARYSTLNV